LKVVSHAQRVAVDYERTITLHISWNIHQPWERLQAAWELGLAPLVPPVDGGWWGSKNKVFVPRATGDGCTKPIAFN